MKIPILNLIVIIVAIASLITYIFDQTTTLFLTIMWQINTILWVGLAGYYEIKLKEKKE